MKGHIDKSYSPVAPEDDPARPRTKEEQDATARRLKPHSKSSANLNRAAEKPEPMTNLPSGPGGKPAKKNRPTKWQFGIRSRNSPAEAMLAIYKALVKMGAAWEIPKPKEMDNPDESGPSTRSNSPEYSDSDPGSGTDPEYATHEEQQRRRERRAMFGRDSNEARGRKRPGKWNGWGYEIPDDPWVIHARFKKDGMFAPGIPHPASAHGSQVSLSDRRVSAAAAMGMTSSTNTSGENISHTGPGSVNSQGGSINSAVPKPQESVWVYVTIQLYAIEQDFFLVDFKCAGYERLVRRFAQEVNGSNESDVVQVDLAEEEGLEDDDMEEDDEGNQLVGAGRPQDDKEITSPFPFLDVASRLIIQLAEAND
jgi:carbon catabolite-derepressing protein kinase